MLVFCSASDPVTRNKEQYLERGHAIREEIKDMFM